jgi:L-amino acid N-acyltransferase YncA
MQIRELTADDWPSVERVFASGIATGHATFETAPPTWTAFDAGKVPHSRLVAELDGAVVGWVAASPISSRPVYSGVVEHSVYVDESARGHGVGRRLLDEFITSAEAKGVWTIQSSIFPENGASLHLHEQAGFVTVGRRRAIARMTYGPLAGQWRDTLLLERRSAIS